MPKTEARMYQLILEEPEAVIVSCAVATSFALTLGEMDSLVWAQHMLASVMEQDPESIDKVRAKLERLMKAVNG